MFAQKEGECVPEQDIVQLLNSRDRRGAEIADSLRALMRYIISPILPNAQTLRMPSEVFMRVWDKIEQYDPGVALQGVAHRTDTQYCAELRP